VKRSELKRTKGLKRSAPKPKARIPHNVRRSVYRRQNWCCVACGMSVLTALSRLDLHHVLPQQTWPEHGQQPFNLVAICPGCHDNHERAHRRIRYDELPEQVRTWIRTLGGRETLYVERTYPTGA
jgi:5-methylcytosine-specific restriction endonuclease McrA